MAWATLPRKPVVFACGADIQVLRQLIATVGLALPRAIGCWLLFGILSIHSGCLTIVDLVFTTHNSEVIIR